MRNLCINFKMVKDCLSVRLSPKTRSNIHSVSKLQYEEVVKTLNSLQTNAAVLQEYKKRDRRSHAVQAHNLEETLKYLSRSGVSVEQLDGLSVIHVSGTKGKGSTCAFCESILRQHGFKTGFYSSPHLVAVRERIRINGRPLGHKEFSEYFWTVYNALVRKKECEYDMPPYFKFLTVMAFNVFLAEKVDVAIMEVGIGGEYDCTNILRKVVAVGITSLGLDHTSLLGDRLEDIAWQKSGIMKPGAVAFTVQQPEETWEVLKKRSVERQCPLLVVPPLETYKWDCNITKLRLSAPVQALNASLALQLANAWLQRQKELTHIPEYIVKNGCTCIPMAPPFSVQPNMMQGLKTCSWPGRTQIIHKDTVTYFLDGAHTAESIEMCASWFQQSSRDMASGEAPIRVLLFNATGDRDSSQLLAPLLNCYFDVAVFCPNIVTTTVNATSDTANFMVCMKQQQLRCENNEEAWLGLQEKAVKCYHSNSQATVHPPKSSAKTKLFPCISEALTYVETQQACDRVQPIQVLVTGSLHLVGSVLSILDPELTMETHQLSADVKSQKCMSNGAAGIS